jgi:hypothetical protein
VYDVSSGPTYAVNPAHLPMSSSMPLFKLAADGKVFRYYISRTASLSIDILDAKGRVIRKIASSMQAEGWHPVKISGAVSGADARGCGVYFARFTINGRELAAKRVLMVR